MANWLPPLVKMNDYPTFEEFIHAAYSYFVDDFIKDEPVFLSVPVKSKRMESYQGMDHSFWHCIEEKIPGAEVSEDNRVPKIALCERIRWAKPIIENAIREQGILAWKEIYRGKGTKLRVHLYFEEEDYVVVLDPRGENNEGEPRYYYLWTTYLCEFPRQRAAMKKRAEKGIKIS